MRHVYIDLRLETRVIGAGTYLKCKTSTVEFVIVLYFSFVDARILKLCFGIKYLNAPASV